MEDMQIWIAKFLALEEEVNNIKKNYATCERVDDLESKVNSVEKEMLGMKKELIDISFNTKTLVQINSTHSDLLEKLIVSNIAITEKIVGSNVDTKKWYQKTTTKVIGFIIGIFTSPFILQLLVYLLKLALANFGIILPF